jgi:hypothetical protein
MFVALKHVHSMATIHTSVQADVPIQYIPLLLCHGLKVTRREQKPGANTRLNFSSANCRSKARAAKANG